MCVYLLAKLVQEIKIDDNFLIYLILKIKELEYFLTIIINKFIIYFKK